MYEMTIEEAIRLLDPETTAEAIAEIKYYAGFSGKKAAIHAIEDACIIAVEIMKNVKHGEWIPVFQQQYTPVNKRAFLKYKCSLCGRTRENIEPFCNCGAKMKE